MAIALPFLTVADPPATSEGTLDPLGLYQISDQLASELVPAVRERMIRVRFLTTIAVGSFVREGLADDQSARDAAPHLAWEWHVVEAMVRSRAHGEVADGIWGVPGSVVARRAIKHQDYLDARSYLSTPRVFGFHGVYKRLAQHLGITDVHLAPGPAAERLIDCWAKDRGLAGLRSIEPLLARWRAALERTSVASPPKTDPRWKQPDWLELAQAFAPDGALLEGGDRRLGALPDLWHLQREFNDNSFREEVLHERLEARDRSYAPLLAAIRAYETFSRAMQDSFDVLRHRAAARDHHGFSLSDIAPDQDFQQSIEGLVDKFHAALGALSELRSGAAGARVLFADRFAAFQSLMDSAQTAISLHELHERVQREKSAEGKRPWFERLGCGRIFVRPNYRIPAPTIQPGSYLHAYRGRPIRRFFQDLRQR